MKSHNFNNEKLNTIPIIFDDMDLNKRFLQNLIENKNCSHLQGLLKVYQKGFLFNEPFVFHHYNIKSKTSLSPISNSNEFLDCFYYSNVISEIFPENKENIFIQNSDEIVSFKHKIDVVLKSTNGYSIFFYGDIVYVYLNYFKEDDLIRNSPSTFSSIERNKKEDMVVLIRNYLVKTKNKLKYNELSLIDFEKLLHFVDSHDIDSFEKFYSLYKDKIQQKHEKKVFDKIKNEASVHINNDMADLKESRNLYNFNDLENLNNHNKKEAKTLSSSQKQKVHKSSKVSKATKDLSTFNKDNEAFDVSTIFSIMLSFLFLIYFFVLIYT